MFFRNYLSTKKKKKQWLCVWSKLFRALSVGSTHYRALLNSSEWVLGRFAKHYFSKPPTYQKDVRYQQSASVCNSNFNDGKFPMENWKISPNLGSILSCRERERARKRDFSSSRLTSLLELTSRLKLLWIYCHVISPVDPKWKYKDWKCWLRGQY